MSLTTPGCSMGQHMADDIKSKVSSLENIDSVEEIKNATAADLIIEGEISEMQF